MIKFILLFVTITLVSCIDIQEPRTGYKYPTERFGLPIEHYGINVLKPPVEWGQGWLINSTLASIALYKNNKGDYLMHIQIFWYRWFWTSISSASFTWHIKKVMEEENKKHPGRFSDKHLQLTEACLKSRDQLRQGDQFMFYYVAKEQMIHAYFKAVSDKQFTETARYSIDDFKTYYDYLLERYVETDQCKITDPCKQQLDTYNP